MKRNLNHWQLVIFWYANITSLGLLFFIAWFLDGLTPREIIKYVYGSSSSRKVSK